MSLPMATPLTREILSASAPYLSMTSKGSMPLPKLLDIFLPKASLTSPWMSTYRKGGCFMNSMDEKIIRATQKKMMSYPVTRMSVGKKYLRSSVSSGQPMVEKGQSADENQVSSTSSSWCTGPPHLVHLSGAVRATMISPQSSQYHAGILWPHQSCLE